MTAGDAISDIEMLLSARGVPGRISHSIALRLRGPVCGVFAMFAFTYDDDVEELGVWSSSQGPIATCRLQVLRIRAMFRS